MEKHFRDEWVEKWFAFIQTTIKRDARPKPKQYSACLCSNANIDLEFIAKHSEFKWDWQYVSANPNLPFDFVLQHPELNWYWYELSRHKNVTFQMILDNREKFGYISGAVENPNITLKMLQTHEYFARDETCETGEENDADFDENDTQTKNPFLWDWVGASKNPSIPFDDILTIKSNWKYGISIMYSLYEILSRSVNLNIDYVFANLNRNWDLELLFANPNIGKHLTDDHLAKLVKCGLSYDVGRERPFRTILDNLYLPMEFLHETIPRIACKNEFLTMKHITENINMRWCYLDLCKNEMKHDRETYIANKISSLLFIAMHEQKSTIFHTTLFEQIVADEYVVMYLKKY